MKEGNKAKFFQGKYVPNIPMNSKPEKSEQKGQ